jgi:hypothetical protein
MKTLLLAAVVAASLSLPLPSQAATRTVSVADLDLASPNCPPWVPAASIPCNP